MEIQSIKICMSQDLNNTSPAKDMSGSADTTLYPLLGLCYQNYETETPNSVMNQFWRVPIIKTDLPFYILPIYLE